MQCNYTILFQTLVRGAVITIRPPASSIGDRKHMTADLLQPAQGHSPRPVLQELVAGIVAGWTKLLVHLPPWSSLACGLAGVHDSVVNESVQPDKRGVDDARRAVRAKVCSSPFLSSSATS